MALSDITKLVSVEYLAPMIAAFLVGVAFSGAASKTIQIVLGILSVTFLVIGFNSFNAIYDKNIDRINKPNRPLPSGKLSNTQVFWLTIVFFAVSIILAISINYTFLFIDLIGIVLAVIYSHPVTYLKKYPLINTMIGNLTFAVIYPMEGWSLNTSFPVPIYIILLLFFVGFGTAVLKDFEDVEGDKKHGIKTFPVIFDHAKAAKVVSLIFIISFFMLLGLIIRGELGLIYFIVALPIILAAINAYLLSKNNQKNSSRRSFMYGMLLLTLIAIFLVGLKLF
jgi:geranylgeranylglycerol-phosphate geranylgeranyltransferase